MGHERARLASAERRTGIPLAGRTADPRRSAVRYGLCVRAYIAGRVERAACFICGSHRVALGPSGIRRGVRHAADDLEYALHLLPALRAGRRMDDDPERGAALPHPLLRLSAEISGDDAFGVCSFVG